jgi:hypothetical protein
MGQQQLLLLVLGIVIVGIAVVAGIQAFSEGRDRSAKDAARSDAMRIVSDIQAWVLKPAAFGGPVRENGTFELVSFANIGYNADANNVYETLNGCFEIEDFTGVVVQGSDPEAPEYEDGIATIALRVKAGVDCAADPFAKVHVGGTNPGSITWE